MLKVRNMVEFSLEIERLVKDKHMLYMEAVCEHLKKYGIEYDNAKVKSLLSPKIQQELYDEAVKLNMFNKNTVKKKLPLL